MTNPDFLVLTIDEAGDRRATEDFKSTLEALGSGLTVPEQPCFGHLTIRHDARYCQAMLSSKQRYYTTDFWDRGVCYGSLRAKDPSDLARAVDYFLCQRGTADGLRGRWADAKISEKARAHEEGHLVDFAWSQYLASDYATDRITRFHQHVLTLAQHTRLRSLLPFTSMSMVCFSTRTGWPYTRECPVLEDRLEGQCSLSPNSSKPPCFIGSIEEAVAHAVAILPASVTVARDGTALDDGD